MLCIGVDESHVAEVLSIARSETDVWASVGQHPEAAAESWTWIEPLLTSAGVVAVGETGLDYHHAGSAEIQARQRACFEHQLELAGRHRLPVIVHTRSAEADTIALIRAHPEVVGVLHCFTESWQLAEAALALGYYVSISGIVTFKNGENVREVARRVPDDRLLVETDAPWLAPVPHRGRQNRPAYVVDTARYVAELRGTDFETLAAQTSSNFFRLFPRARPDSRNQNSSS